MLHGKALHSGIFRKGSVHAMDPMRALYSTEIFQIDFVHSILYIICQKVNIGNLEGRNLDTIPNHFILLCFIPGYPVVF